MIVWELFLDLVEVAETGHQNLLIQLLHTLLKVEVADYSIALVLVAGAWAVAVVAGAGAGVVVVVVDQRCYQKPMTWVDCCVGCTAHVHRGDTYDCCGGGDCCCCYDCCCCCCCYCPDGCYADVICPSSHYYFHYYYMVVGDVMKAVAMHHWGYSLVGARDHLFHPHCHFSSHFLPYCYCYCSLEIDGCDWVHLC